MAKALRTVGKVAGVIAVVGAFVPFLQPIAGIAAVISTAANLGAQALTKPPPARGSVTEVVVEVDPPSPYCMGEGYFAGVKRFHAGYGATLKKVPNPYLAEVLVYSVGGPIQGPITPLFDFGAVSSWFSGFFDHDSQLGAAPEASALVAPYGTPPGWTSAHKLSGQAAVLWNHKFDKDGKRYASGLPQRGIAPKWVKVYDPRLDSTFPGGSGSHRIDDESTWTWSENPALHAGTYAYGRYQNGKRVMGMGLPFEAIGDSFKQIAAWANDCDANGWSIFGVVFEGGGAARQGQRWANLRDICIAGGGEPMPLNTGIGFHWDRPRVVLDTVTEEDIAGDIEITAMQSWRDRLNTVIPKFVSPEHDWSLVPCDEIQNATYLAEDGEVRRETWNFNFVDNDQQAGQLAAYKLANSRELYPLTLRCMPRLRAYRPGDCLQLTIEQNGETVIDTPAVILNREVDPATYEVTLTFIGETAAKHAWALGRSAVAPPSPTIGMTAQERDELASASAGSTGFLSSLISASYTVGLAGNITQSDDPAAFGGTGGVTITIPEHIRRYGGAQPDVTVAEFEVTVAYSAQVLISYDDPELAGGTVTPVIMVIGTDPVANAYASESNPYRHFLASVTAQDSGGSGGESGGSGPSGSGGWIGAPGTSIP